MSATSQAWYQENTNGEVLVNVSSTRQKWTVSNLSLSVLCALCLTWGFSLITTSRRFKCVPQILGSLSIHIFKLLFFLITHSRRVFADYAAHFVKHKFFDVDEKYFFCFQPVLGIKTPRQIYRAAWSIVTQRKIKIHGSGRQQITDDEIFFKQKNEFTNV